MAEPHRDEISKLEALYSDNPEGRVFTLLAEAYRKAGELDRAREVLENGLKRHSGYASAYVVLGRVLGDLQKGDEAEGAFRRVLELDPENLVALRALGDRARNSGNTADALRYYRELLLLDPSDEELQESVASLEKDLANAPPVPPPAAPPAWGSAPATGHSEPGFGEVSIDTEGSMAALKGVETPTGTAGFGNISFEAEGAIGDVSFSGDSLSLDSMDLSGEPETGSLSFGGDTASADAPLDFGAGSLDLGAGSLDLDSSGLDLGGDTGWSPDDAAAGLPPLTEDAAETAESSFGAFGDSVDELPGFDEPAGELPALEDLAAGPAGELPSFGGFDGPLGELPAVAAESAGEDFGFEGFGAASHEPLEDAAAFAAEMPLIEEPAGPAEPELETGTFSGGAPAGFAGIPADDGPGEAFPFTLDGDTTPAVPGLDGWSEGPQADDPGALEAAAAGAEPWVLEDEARVGGEVATETMAELYRGQGLHDRAAEVYRTLLAQRPDDAGLAAKLREVEALAATEEARSAWTGANTAATADDSLYAWAGDGGEDDQDGSPRVAEYFGGLLSWRPANPARRPAPAAAAAPQPAQETSPVHAAAAEAAAPEITPAFMTQEPQAAEPFPAFDEPSAAATPPAQAAPEPAASAPPAAAEDDLAWLFDDEPAAAPAAAPKASAPAPAAPEPEGEDDDDLDMFRSWLQSLKR